jgi:hypothetical protein
MTAKSPHHNIECEIRETSGSTAIQLLNVWPFESADQFFCGDRRRGAAQRDAPTRPSINPAQGGRELPPGRNTQTEPHEVPPTFTHSLNLPILSAQTGNHLSGGIRLGKHDFSLGPASK